MTVAFYMVQYDLLPIIEATLTDTDGVAITIDEGTTIKFHMIDMYDGIIVEGDASIVEGEEGTVQYEWQDGDTDISGTYKAEFELTMPGSGYTITYPAEGNLFIHIRAKYIEEEE